jgi:hypothetical protein
MKVNGEDIAAYGARQLTTEMAYGDITNQSEWVQGCRSPIMLGGTVGFKKIKVCVILKGDTRSEIWENGNRLIASLISPAVLQLDGFEHYFCAYLKNASQAERSIKKWHKATLELYGYEFGEEVTGKAQKTSGGRTLTVYNPGTAETPAVIELTPEIGKVSLTISGAVRDDATGDDVPITVTNLTKDATIILDGEAGLITEGGANKFQDVDMYDLPSLKPGQNTISHNQADVAMVVRFKPRYL